MVTSKKVARPRSHCFDQETSPTLLVGYAEKAFANEQSWQNAKQSPLLATGASFIARGADVPSTVTWIQRIHMQLSN
ncbi:MAG: hypothetical protein ACFFDI_13475 [Promethearchaeota archaeon]